MALDVGEVREFLRLVDAPDLFAWLGVPWTASSGRRMEALKAKRSWAQAQQANPKHGRNAKWVIRNMGELQRLLVDEPSTYRTMLAEELREQGEERLRDLVDSLGQSASLSDTELEIVERFAHRQGLEAGHTRDLLQEWGRLQSPSTDPTPSLDSVIQEVLATGRLSSHELSRVLEMGRLSGLPESVLALMLLDQANRAAS